MPKSSIRVLIVDDSAAMRQLLKSILSSAPDIEVVATANDPVDAREKIKRLDPDVLTLDVEMPKMDGLTFLEKLMRARPMPVLMVSSLTQTGADVTLRALELGAVDYVAKPQLDTLHGTAAVADELIAKVRAIAGARILRAALLAPPSRPHNGFRLTNQVVAIGASTGGTEAIREVLEGFPIDGPPTVIVQHMPAGFTASFAKRLNDICPMTVKEAQNGDRVTRGLALLAPGDHHVEIIRSGAEFYVRVFVGPPVNRHRPSVDVLFDSFASQARSNSVGAILTGMGADGALGMKRMHAAGAYTIAQDEATSVVFGMPKEAIAKGGVSRILPLESVADGILEACSRQAA